MANPSSWNEEEVCQWLCNVDLEELKTKFEGQKIDGKTLLRLTERMQEILCPNMQVQFKLHDCIEDLKKNLTKEKCSISLDESNSSIVAQEPPQPNGNSTNWPLAYRLPEFPPAVMASLLRKDPSLYKKERTMAKSALIQSLFDQMTSYTWYPAAHQYNEVLSSLIVKYPFLRDSSPSGYDCLRNSLRNKFKHERIPLTSDEQIENMRAKYGENGGGRKRRTESEDHSDLPREKRQTIKSLYTLQEEDEHSLALNEAYLLSETKKSRPKLDQMKSVMARTSKNRSTLIKGMKTKEIMEKFPYLSIPQLLLHEVIINYSKDLEATLSTSLQELSQAIVTKAMKGNRTKSPIGVQSAINGCIEIEEQNALKQQAALILLPQLLLEKEQLFVYNEEESSPYPLLKLKGGKDVLHPTQMDIVADGMQVTSLNEKEAEISYGISLLMSVYWAFGFKYPPGLRKTFSFLENFIFKFNSSRAPPISVIRLHTELSKL